MIRVSQLNKTYARRDRQVLHDVSFTLPDTGFVCIVGASGCGKTSLLNAIGGLDVFDSGSVSTDSLPRLRCGRRETEAERSRSFGYIFQNYYLLPEHSVAYNIYLGLHALALSHKEKLARVKEALEAVDMARYARRNVSALSGGQQQRVAIARALARRPRVIFADEPTGNLDRANTLNICTLLHRISRHSLVVMVTHEESIARFFADRIITLEEGCIRSDRSDWARGDLEAEDGALYVGDYQETALEAEGLQLRLLQQEGAAPVQLTLLALKDRIVIKLDDSRSISCTTGTEVPELREGKRPLLRLEMPEEDAPAPEAPTATCRAGKGLSLSMLWQEARRFGREKGLRRIGTWLFLVALTVLTLLTVADYLKIATIDPEDFITTDSHILEIELARDEGLGTSAVGIRELTRDYVAYLNASGQDFDYVPHISLSATYSIEVFKQMGAVSVSLSNFSYVPLSRLDESQLIHGRMPEDPDEIVADRWVLEALMEQDGIIQSGIGDVTYFLGKEFHYQGKNFTAKVVGISDCGEPAVFLDTAAMASIGAASNEVIRLSDLQELGDFDDLHLGYEECIILTNNAGPSYAQKVGGNYATNSLQSYTIVATVEADTYALMVVADEYLEDRLQSMLTSHFFLYCEDKAAMKALISNLPEELEGKLQVFVTDKYTTTRNQYLAATQRRLDARTIVTMTVILISLVMLYLLQRSKIHERIGMIGVYRLLGIPGRKLVAVFAMESLLIFLKSTLPAAAVTWAAVAVLSAMPSLEVSLLLPWQTAGCIALAIFLFHLLLSILPLLRLLRQPPARLAAKFDF